VPETKWRENGRSEKDEDDEKMPWVLLLLLYAQSDAEEFTKVSKYLSEFGILISS
jgi:hypothetical protein